MGTSAKLLIYQSLTIKPAKFAERGLACGRAFSTLRPAQTQMRSTFLCGPDSPYRDALIDATARAAAAPFPRFRRSNYPMVQRLLTSNPCANGAA
jgi:hypothetical protein